MRFAVLGVCAAMLGCGDDNNTGADMTVVADMAIAVDQAMGGCQPRQQISYTPIWRPPTGARQNRCTPTQITDGMSALLGGTFNAFKTANSDCAACMVTTSTNPMRGPLVSFPLGIIDGNRDGCLALRTGDASASSCAAKVQARFDCGLVACSSCPITSNDDIPALNVCAARSFATGGVCESYVAPSECTNAAFTDAGTVPTECSLAGQGVPAWFTYLVTLFCGG